MVKKGIPTLEAWHAEQSIYIDTYIDIHILAQDHCPRRPHSLRLAVCPDVRMCVHTDFTFYTHRCTDRHVCERKKASGEYTSLLFVRLFVVVLQRVSYSRPHPTVAFVWFLLLLLLPCLTYFVIEFNAGGNEKRLDVACGTKGTKRQPVAAAVPYASACCCCDCCSCCCCC